MAKIINFKVNKLIDSITLHTKDNTVTDRSKVSTIHMVALVLVHISTEVDNVKKRQRPITSNEFYVFLFYLDGQYGGSYYNQYPGSNSFYQGYGSSYNRPNNYGSNYYPSSGSYGGGGYFWNSSSKNHLNQYTLFLSLLFTLLAYVVTK